MIGRDFQCHLRLSHRNGFHFQFVGDRPVGIDGRNRFKRDEAVLLGTTALAAEPQPGSPGLEPAAGYRTIGLGIAAALSVGISILGAGYAVGRIGSAAVGAIAEKPELLPRAILFVALGEGLAVLGFAFAMMLLQKM